MTGLIVCGVTGRMGRLIAEGAAAAGLSLVGGTVRPGSPAEHDDLGKVLGVAPLGVHARADLAAAVPPQSVLSEGRPVVVDFTSPASLSRHLEVCLERELPLLVGTTGLDDAQKDTIKAAGQRIPVLYAANTSLGANLLTALTRIAAGALPDADIEIVELHHRQKQDSPSGTALMLGRAAAEARGQEWDAVATLARAGQAPRRPGKIGVFGVRGGTVPGEHTVHLFLDDERIELSHRVQDRRIFAAGALRAARFLGARPAGVYSMADVLGLAS